ncbi:MAG: acyl carrier protein [Methanoregulaceae archaeon]|nr:acyl carrier protein [Methanoregulaceae archaeon]
MEDRINMVLKRVFDLTDAELARDLSRADIAKWDSLTHMDLVVSLEQEFGLNFTIDEIIALDGIGRVRSILKEKGVS